MLGRARAGLDHDHDLPALERHDRDGFRMLDEHGSVSVYTDRGREPLLNRGSAAARSSRSKWRSAYAPKSKSSSEIAPCTTPQAASRASDISRISCSAASRPALGGSP